jgi:hypothetical protein
MKLARPFVRMGELILVDAKLSGPRGEGEYQLVLDTGADATTLLPEMGEELGYSARDGIRPKTMHSALSEEGLQPQGRRALGSRCDHAGLRGPRLRSRPPGFDGLLGMNFLRHFNFEVRPVDQQILLELTSGDWRPVLDEEITT